MITKTLAKTLPLTQFFGLIAIATLAPFLGRQAFTGPIVNATLFASVILLGFSAGVFVSFIPSLISLIIGVLAPQMISMVPFIMLGNIFLVGSFNLLRKRNYWLAMIVASVLKFGLLFVSSRMILQNDILISMMSWPQLFTALAGGMIVFVSNKKTLA